MNLLSSRTWAFVIAGVFAGELHAIEAERPSFTIEGKTVYFREARVIDVKEPSAVTPGVIPKSDRELRISVSATGFPDFGRVIHNLKSLELHLSDGQILKGRKGGSGSGNGEQSSWELASFEMVPWHEKELTLRIETNAQRFELPFKNPGYLEKVPEWQPKSLPLTWKDGDVEATLEGLGLTWNDDVLYKVFGWELKQTWSVKWKGKPANGAFSAYSWVEDPGGNRSRYGGVLGASAWRLHCSVSRSYGFPFEKEEVHWFGWTEGARFKAIPPGECDLLDIGEAGREHGISFAGLFGPGIYELKDGKLLSKAPLPPEAKRMFVDSDFYRDSGITRMILTTPAFAKQVRRNGKPGWGEIYLDREGKPVHLGGQGSQAGDTTIWHQELWAANGRSFQYGIANFGAPKHFEFYVRPPSIPRKPR